MEAITVTTTMEEETMQFGRRLGAILSSGDVVLLTGDLGAGKTHFTGGIARALEIDDYITSPTFTVVNEYDGGRIPLIHFDIYRLGSYDELFEIGFEDYLERGGICVIEWADLIPEIEERAGRIFKIDIRRMDHVSPNHREITICLPEGERL